MVVVVVVVVVLVVVDAVAGPNLAVALVVVIAVALEKCVEVIPKSFKIIKISHLQYKNKYYTAVSISYFLLLFLCTQNISKKNILNPTNVYDNF